MDDLVRSQSFAALKDGDSENTPVSEDSAATVLCWHVISSEYPPEVGGVSDYTEIVATGLGAQGDEVHIWCPKGPGSVRKAKGVTVHRELGTITPADLARVGQELDSFPAPRR